MSINIPKKLTTARTTSDKAAGNSTAIHSTAKVCVGSNSVIGNLFNKCHKNTVSFVLVKDINSTYTTKTKVIISCGKKARYGDTTQIDFLIFSSKNNLISFK